MHHGPELLVVAVVCLTLVIGAAARAVGRKITLPYTVLMLGLGLAAGVALRTLAPDAEPFEALRHPVSTDLILFVFLPALIFESAFALDVHAFRKNVGFVAVLAGPAMVLATLATAGGAYGLTRVFGELPWGWPAALVFGALISATDPVAVVALLRDVGAPKRLGLLIEGESLLNDGTAIVVFTVLLSLLTGETSAVEPGSVALSFVKVVAGGVAVGWLFGWLATTWLARTYDDPLVEITVTLVLAYAAMVVAEAVLHVSGVLAIVTAGLMAASRGRTRISPEVRHFLHEFWEMLAYVANTLVFFLVGVVIAVHLHEAPWPRLGLIASTFGLILVVRFAAIFLFRPLANRFVREPVSPRQATVMAWGGLRGAVSLALALMVATHPDVPSAVGESILELTAGVVLATIVIGGLSTGKLLAKLGFVTATPAEALAEARAHRQVQEELLERVERARGEDGMGRLPWPEVIARAEAKLAAAREVEEEARVAFEAAGEAEAKAALFRASLAVERRAYRAAFAEGTLSADALDLLEGTLDAHLDRAEAGAPEDRPDALPARTRWRRALATLFGEDAIARQALRHDVSRAELAGARAARKSLGARATPLARDVDGWYAERERAAVARLEELRAHLPEVAAAVEARLVERIALNAEQAGYARLAKRGELEEAPAARALESVKRRLEALHFTQPKITLRETAELCRLAPLFRDLPEDALEELAVATEERVVEEGEALFEQGDSPNAAYVIAAGVVSVTRDDERVATLGGGDLVGEMGLLTDERRNATARAESTVTVGRIAASTFTALLENRPALRERVWASLGRRMLDNAIRDGRLGELDREQRTQLRRDASTRRMEPDERMAPEPGRFLVLDGRLRDGKHAAGPGELVSAAVAWRAETVARLLRLP